MFGIKKSKTVKEEAEAKSKLAEQDEARVEEYLSTAKAERKSKLKGAPVLLALLPGILLAALLVVGLIVYFGSSVADQNRQYATGVLGSVSQGIAFTIGELTRQQSNRVSALANMPYVAAALRQSDEARRTAEQRLAKALPDALQVRLLPSGWNQTDNQGKAPLGYAALDQATRATREGRMPALEVHGLNDGRMYVGIAAPVMADGQQPIGSILAAYPVDQFTFILASLQDLPGTIWLEQKIGVNGQSFATSKGLLPEAGRGLAGATITGSIWELRYEADQDGHSVDLLWPMVIGALLVSLIGLLQAGVLQMLLRKDLEKLVDQCNSPGKSSPPKLSLREVHKAMLGMSRQPKPAATTKGKYVPPVMTLGAERERDSQLVDEEGEKEEAPKPKKPIKVKPAPAGTGGMEVSELEGSIEEAANLPVPMKIPENIFRAYDIRGLTEGEITPKLARRLGTVFGAIAKEKGQKQVFLARDARETSSELAEALGQGINEVDQNVVDLGMAPTPLLSFATATGDADCGIVVTGSHNAAEYNGFKLTLSGQPVAGEALKKFAKLLAVGVKTGGDGERENADFTQVYIDQVAEDIAISRELKVVVDAGNGAAGPLATALFATLGCEVVELYCEPDGKFPNHHPDPSRPENLRTLCERVREEEADLGLALDGDGDRLTAVDSDGRIQWPDRLLMLFAADLLTRSPGADILFDVKSSRHLSSYVLAHGGRPVMTASGHARVRAKMKESGAMLAGEFTGHIFFKDRWHGFDDALYAGARLLEILSLDPRSSADIFDEMPLSPSTPELVMKLQEGEALPLIRQAFGKARFPSARIIKTDGLRVELAEAWGLIRPSNTSPSITFRFEGDNDEALREIQDRFRELLLAADPDLDLPF